MNMVKQHWENIYDSKADNEVSWFQENPLTSLNLIEKYSSGRLNCSFIDVGGGNSLLVSKMLERNFTDITLLDISKKAIERSLKRITDSQIKSIESNILELEVEKPYEIWHDRAVFHFLTKELEIDKYIEIVKKSIQSKGYLILATFSESGPEKCSGLDITQYSEAKFKSLFEPFFELQECFDQVHTTPTGNIQNFVWAVFRKI